MKSVLSAITGSGCYVEATIGSLEQLIANLVRTRAAVVRTRCWPKRRGERVVVDRLTCRRPQSHTGTPAHVVLRMQVLKRACPT